MEQSISNQPTNQSAEQVRDQALHEKSPSISTDSKVLRPLRRALGIAALATAALGPGKAEAMNQNTAAFINLATGVVLRPGPNGTTIDVNATRHNHQIILQQKAQREQAEAMQRRNMEIQAAFNRPTNFNIQPALAQLSEMGVVAVVTDNTLYLYHKDKINTPEFLKSQFKISSSNNVKIVNFSLVPVPGGFRMQSQYIQVQGQQAIKATEERMLALDPASKTFNVL